MNLFVPYIAPSTNAMYSGQHWRKRMEHKKQALLAVLSALSGRKDLLKKFTNPVRISVHPVLAKNRRAYDVSNYSYTYKLIEDCLVERKILQNDTPGFVRSVLYLSPTKGAATGIEITIEECE